MSNRKRYTFMLVVCVVALFVSIFFEPAYGWHLRGWLEGRANIQAAGAVSPVAQDEVLQAQLAALQSVAAQVPQNQDGAIRAMVYVQYPFGFKNELLVNAGTDEGVATGSAVTFQGIFIGTVVQAFANSAVIQTVFDPSFKMPVRIGANTNSSGTAASYDALLLGGADPEATSIAKTAAIVAGDILYTAAPGLPYGLPIGIVNATSTSADNLFQAASVNFGYDLDAIETVLISHQ